MLNKYFLGLFIVLSYITQAQENGISASRIISGAQSDVLSISSHYKNPLLIYGSNDCNLYIHRADSTMKLVAKMNLFKHPVSVVQFNKMGNNFLAASQGPVDYPVIVFDSVGNKVQTLEGNQSKINAAIFDNSGKYVFTGAENGKIILFDWRNAKIIKQFDMPSAINSLAMSNDPRFLIVACADPIIKVISITNGQVVKTFVGHQDIVNSIKVSLNNKWLISGSNDKSARIWDMNTCKELYKLNVDCWKVLAVNLSVDSKIAITGCNDGSIKIWETETGKMVKNIDAQNYIVKDLVLSSDSKRIITAPVLRNEENFGVRVYESGLNQMKEPESNASTRFNFNKTAIDSIQKIRKLNHADSILYKLNSTEYLNKNNKTNIIQTHTDSARIYKTPMRNR